MKKLLLFVISCFFLASNSVSAIETDIHTNIYSLPEPAKNLLNNYFEDIQIVAVVQNRESKSYEVRTSDGKKLDFKESGEWFLIDCNNDEIPFILVPKKIRTHIAKKYGPYVHAVEIKRSKKGFKVELNNHVELMFKI